MRSCMKVEQDYFKLIAKKFCKRIEIVKNKLLSLVKVKQAQAAKLFEVTRLHKAMVFELDDESIPEVDLGALAAGVVPQSGLVALNSSIPK